MSYFSRITLDASNYQANHLLRRISQNSYHEHQALWQLFPNDSDASRDFLYRTEQRHLQRVIYMLSAREPEAVEGWLVESKPYQPAISDGEELAFSLRVNPVVTRKDDTGKRHRHDVVMNAKREIAYKTTPCEKQPALSLLIQKVGVEWLAKRSEKAGFEFNKQVVTIESYDQHQSYKQSNKGAIRYSTMDMMGVLKVVDAEKFKVALHNGIGPAKAFGCGLMLIRRL